MECGVSSKMHAGQIGIGIVQILPSMLGEEKAELTSTISHSQIGHDVSNRAAASSSISFSTSRGRSGIRHNTMQCSRKELFNSAHSCTVAHNIDLNFCVLRASVEGRSDACRLVVNTAQYLV